MSELKLIGSARVGDIQAGVYSDDEKLYIVVSRVIIGEEEPEILGVEEFDLIDKPKNLFDATVSEIKSWLSDILTAMYPYPEQRKNLELLVTIPDSPVTQALIETCLVSDCVCPLAYSIGCIEYVPKAIVPKIPSNKRFDVLPSLQKKSVGRALSSLRRYVSWEELRNWLSKFTAAGEEELMLGVYREVV